jgi:hypothetical protein
VPARMTGPAFKGFPEELAHQFKYTLTYTCG